MSSKDRNCPQCRAAMDFRLGQFECPSCGHTELIEQPTQEEKSSGPGFKREQQWGGSGGRTNVPPGVAPPPAAGTVFSSESSHTFGREDSTPPKYHSSLQTEKHIYFGLNVLGHLVNIGGVGSSMGQDGAAAGFGVVFTGAIVGNLLLAYVLYGSELWPKQCCMGCTGFQVLAYLGSLFFIGTLQRDINALNQFEDLMLAGGFAFLFVFIGVATSAWLIWILYRDAQYLS